MIFLGIPEQREREREREHQSPETKAADEGESTAIHSCALSPPIKVNFKINLGCGSSFSLTDHSFFLFLWSFFLFLPSKQIWILSLPFCHPFLPHRSTFSLFPSNQPRPDWTLHVTDLVPSLKNHTLSSTLTHFTLSHLTFSLWPKPSLQLIILSNFRFLWSLIFLLLLWWCGWGVLVDFVLCGSGFVWVVVSFLWMLVCGWWWIFWDKFFLEVEKMAKKMWKICRKIEFSECYQTLEIATKQ